MEVRGTYGDCGHDRGRGWFQIEDLDDGKLLGWSVSPVPKNHLKGSNNSDGDRYESTASYEAVMIIPVWWLEEGQRLVGSGGAMVKNPKYKEKFLKNNLVRSWSNVDRSDLATWYDLNTSQLMD